MLASADMLAEALAELLALAGSAPREASVHFQLGKLYRRLGDADAALRHFNAALDLKPRAADAALIKAAMEKVGEAEEGEEEEL